VTPSAVAHSIIGIFLTNQNVKPAEILMRPRAQCGDERSQGSSCMTGVSHLRKAEQRSKTCEDYTFCREIYGQRSSWLWRRLICFSDRITNRRLSLLFKVS